MGEFYMKRFIALILILSMLLADGCMAAVADNQTSSSDESAVLTLPSSLITIEEEAFAGDTAVEEVVLPEGIETIGPRAFAGSSLAKINLPDSLTEIDGSAFNEPGTLTVTANNGSYAYA